MKRRAVTHIDLDVYQQAFTLAMDIFEASKHFPREERYALTDQIRRSSRSVCANLAEGWRKRRYRAAFISKLCDVEAELAETQCWLEFAVRCGYLPPDQARTYYTDYNNVTSTIVNMILHADAWLLPKA